MGRHGKKFCMICNPYGNGSAGTPGTEAVGRYYLKRETSDQFQTGWISICNNCVDTILNTDYKIEFFNGLVSGGKKEINTDPRINAGPYDHNWSKDNLVTMEIDGKLVDHCVCGKCGAEGYWFGAPFAPLKGCSIPDGEDK